MAELSEKDRAMDALLAMISRGTYTEAELKKKMCLKGFSDGAVKAALATAREYNYINDTEYAKRYIEVKGKTKGIMRLKEEMKRKGLDEGTIADALEGKDDDLENAFAFSLKFAEKCDINEVKMQEKLARQLAYRGYGYGIVKDCIDRLKK